MPVQRACQGLAPLASAHPGQAQLRFGALAEVQLDRVVVDYLHGELVPGSQQAGQVQVVGAALLVEGIGVRRAEQRGLRPVERHDVALADDSVGPGADLPGAGDVEDVGLAGLVGGSAGCQAGCCGHDQGQGEDCTTRCQDVSHYGSKNVAGDCDWVGRH